MKKVILFTILTVMIAGISNGAQYRYTWKNAEGGLNITDYPPPENVEIIDITVISLPNEKQVVPVIKKQDVRHNKNATQERQLAQAASLRKEEAKLRQNATNLKDEAQELLRIGNKQRHKRSWRYRASIKEKEAKGFIRQAESLARKAEDLERQASQLK